MTTAMIERLSHGSHMAGTGEYCLLEAAAHIAGEQHNHGYIGRPTDPDFNERCNNSWKAVAACHTFPDDGEAS